jgi:hypothetical protein
MKSTERPHAPDLRLATAEEDAHTSLVRKFSPDGRLALTIEVGEVPEACGWERAVRRMSQSHQTVTYTSQTATRMHA